TFHHIVFDGWSKGVLNRELGAHYDACCEGRPAARPQLEWQYADYALAQQGADDEVRRGYDYWMSQLAGIAEMRLPMDRPRPPQRTFAAATHECAVGRALLADIERLARASRATPFMIMLATFVALVARYAQQDDIAVGTPIAN